MDFPTNTVWASWPAGHKTVDQPMEWYVGRTCLLVWPLADEGNAFLFVVARGRKAILYTSLNEGMNMHISKCVEMFCIAVPGFKLYFWACCLSFLIRTGERGIQTRKRPWAGTRTQVPKVQLHYMSGQFSASWWLRQHWLFLSEWSRLELLCG